MGTTYSWHKGAVRVNPVWIASTDLQPDEIFSSWLVRSALLNGCDPMMLTWDMWPQWRPWTTDIDRWVSSDKLRPLSRLSGVSIASFQSAMLRPTASLISNTLPQKVVWPWILAIGSRGSSRRSGQQYCPQCLQGDKKPYFRIQWRFGWHSVCHKHQISLLDRCFECFHPLQPHKLRAEDKSITTCPKCGVDLRKATSQGAHPDLPYFQMIADHIVANGSGGFGKYELSTQKWFELASFCSLLARRLIINATNAHKRLSTIYGLIDLSDSLPPPRDRIELLRIHDRQMLLRGIAILLKKGPDFLKKSMQMARATRQTLCSKGVVLPRVLESIYELLPDNAQRCKRSHPEKKYPPKPTPRHLVEHKMRRIMLMVNEQMR